MLISETTCDFEPFVRVEHTAEVGDQLAAYFEAARGAFSRNTERALRADVEIFVSWCRQQVLPALPASAATVAAFIDDMARVKTPATVRRYVSSIATVHKALRQTNPLDSAARPVRPATDAPAPGTSAGASPGADLADAKPTAGGGRRPADRRPEPRAPGRWATTRCCGAPSWFRWTCLMYWRKSTERRRCSCAQARPIAEGRGATLYLARDTVQLRQDVARTASGVDGRAGVFRSVAQGSHGQASSSTRARCRASTSGWRDTPGFPTTSSTRWPGTARASGRCRT